LCLTSRQCSLGYPGETHNLLLATWQKNEEPSLPFNRTYFESLRSGSQRMRGMFSALTCSAGDHSTLIFIGDSSSMKDSLIKQVVGNQYLAGNKVPFPSLSLVAPFILCNGLIGCAGEDSGGAAGFGTLVYLWLSAIGHFNSAQFLSLSISPFSLSCCVCAHDLRSSPFSSISTKVALLAANFACGCSTRFTLCFLLSFACACL
jgi:hypothetical protein